MAAHRNQSGIRALQSAEDAFAARILLARRADRSLDLQYYIWRSDTTGKPACGEALWDAAERGVRVRVLLDDANTGGLDPMLAALDAHPNIEVRLFNPFANRGLRVGDFALDFSRVNRRMHNKSFTADNQAHHRRRAQHRRRVLSAPTSRSASRTSTWWRSARWCVRSRPPSTCSGTAPRPIPPPACSAPPPGPGAQADLKAGWDRVARDPEATRYIDAVRQTPLLRELNDGRLTLDWTSAHVIHDDPAKVLEATDRSDLQMMPLLVAAFGQPRRELDLVSPYFVPGKDGTRSLVTMAGSGVKVRVLTNSLSATDVSAVHAGYAKYRKQLLEGGVRVYELKPGDAVPPPDKDKGQDGERGGGLPGNGSRGSSASSLHAKTFAIDRERIFVGSFNLDPRSARLNTEMGVIIDSQNLSGQLARQFDAAIPAKAFEVRLQADGQGMEWIERSPQGEVRYPTEPGAGGAQAGLGRLPRRAADRVAAVTPLYPEPTR